MTFHEAARERGIMLLADDLKFIRKMLIRIPREFHTRAMHDYLDLWHRIASECEDALKAQNLARRCSNQWLRELAINGTRQR